MWLTQKWDKGDQPAGGSTHLTRSCLVKLQQTARLTMCGKLLVNPSMWLSLVLAGKELLFLVLGCTPTCVALTL